MTATFLSLPDELLSIVLRRPAVHLRLVCWRWLRALRLTSPDASDWTLGPKAEAASSVELVLWYSALLPRYEFEICLGAARGGHLEVVQWARARSPPHSWDSRVCA